MKHWPYRFKTEKEMIADYGVHWRGSINDSNRNNWCWASPCMDHLFGTILEKDFPDDVYSIRIEDYFSAYIITKNMLTKNKPNIPNYKPKKFTI